jgi:hypothetical protein
MDVKGLATGSQARGCWWAACDSTVAAELMHATLPDAESTVVTGPAESAEEVRSGVKCKSVLGATKLHFHFTPDGCVGGNS